MQMSNPRPSEPLQRLRVAVEQADHVAGAAVYHEAQSLFTACLSSPQYLRNLQQLAPEYGKPEFLLCVDSAGSPVCSTEEIIEDLRAAYPERRIDTYLEHDDVILGDEVMDRGVLCDLADR